MQKRKFMRLAEQLGASVDWENSWVSRDSKKLIVDAPDGCRFVANGHWCVVVGGNYEPVSEVWQELYDLVSMGIQKETPDEAQDRAYEQSI